MTSFVMQPSRHERPRLWVALVFVLVVLGAIVVEVVTKDRIKAAQFAAIALHGAFFLLLLVRPDAAISFLMAAAPLEPMLRTWAGTRFLTFAYGLIFIMLRRPRVTLRRLLPLDLPLILFLIYCSWTVVTIAWARDRSLAISSSALMWGLWATVAAARALIDDEEHLREILGFLLLGAVVSLLLQLATLPDTRGLRLGAHRNMSPQDITSIFVVGLVAIFYMQSQQRRWWWWVTMAGLSGGIVLAVSRGALLALVVGVSSFFFLAPRRSKRMIPIVALLLLLGGGIRIAAEWNPSVYDPRIQRTLHAQNVDQFTTGRISIWRVAGEMIRDNALVGVGAGGFGKEFDRYLRRTPVIMRYGRELGTHSLVLQAAAEGGVPAALILVGFLFTTTLQAWRSRRRVPAVGALAVAWSLVCIVTTAGASVHQIPLWFGMGLGSWTLYVARPTAQAAADSEALRQIAPTMRPVTSAKA